MKTFFATLALLAGGALAVGPSLAAPVGTPSHRPAAEHLATTVATFDCRRDHRGWHYKRGERRVTCRPTRPREGAARIWGWRCEGPRCGWWHQHERRWHDRG